MSLLLQALKKAEQAQQDRVEPRTINAPPTSPDNVGTEIAYPTLETTLEKPTSQVELTVEKTPAQTVSTLPLETDIAPTELSEPIVELPELHWDTPIKELATPMPLAPITASESDPIASSPESTMQAPASQQPALAASLSSRADVATIGAVTVASETKVNIDQQLEKLADPQASQQAARRFAALRFSPKVGINNQRKVLYVVLGLLFVSLSGWFIWQLAAPAQHLSAQFQQLQERRSSALSETIIQPASTSGIAVSTTPIQAEPAAVPPAAPMQLGKPPLFNPVQPVRQIPPENVTAKKPSQASADAGASEKRTHDLPKSSSSAPPSSTPTTSTPQPEPQIANEKRREKPSSLASAAHPPSGGGPLLIQRSQPASVESPAERGYRALSQGNLAAAQSAYQEALRLDSRNIDALNGLAAIAMRENQGTFAAQYVQRALELDPRNSYANSLQALLRPVGGSDESRLKTLSAQADSNNTASLQFALGSQMAQQGRWHEAQEAFFKAHSLDTLNPDYCFNLAVSLDQLKQRNPAKQYYAKAIELAKIRGGQFDLALAQQRLTALGGTP